MKKYNYYLVIQQNFGYGHGWEDVSQYEATSTGVCLETENRPNKYGKLRPVSLCKLDAAEYRLSGYPTRVIFRREKVAAAVC
jgi:hypothetical protein